MEEEAVLLHYGRVGLLPASSADEVLLGLLHGSHTTSLCDKGVEHFGQLGLCPCPGFVSLVLPRDEVFVKGLVEEVDRAVGVVDRDVLQRHGDVHPFVLTSVESVPSSR